MELLNIDVDKLEKYREQAMSLVVEYVPRLALAIATLLFGLWVIKRVNAIFRKILVARDADPTLIPFLSGVVNIALKVMLVVSVASMVGIATTSFVAALGAAGLAIGLALQGSLSNFAGGVLILLFKPFKVGDVIEFEGTIGTVYSITILNTIIMTPQNNRMIIPNGAVANSKVMNYTVDGTRRVDLNIGIAYGADFERAREVLLAALRSDPRVMEDPAPFVGVKNFGDSSVNLLVLAYVPTPDYMDCFFDLNAKIKKALDAAQIEIPFPQRDINIRSGSLSS